MENVMITVMICPAGSRYIERLGTGIRRMAVAMQDHHGLHRPRFEEVGSEFRVTLIGPGERFMEETKELPAWASQRAKRATSGSCVVRGGTQANHHRGASERCTSQIRK